VPLCVGFAGTSGSVKSAPGWKERGFVHFVRTMEFTLKAMIQGWERSQIPIHLLELAFHAAAAAAGESRGCPGAKQSVDSILPGQENNLQF
jgi:hypothetical protein